MLVTINGEKYVAESIKQFPVNPLADAFRVTGIQQRSDNVKLNRYSFSNWNEVGIGVSRLRRQRQNSDGTITGQHIGAMRDADAETRFANAITLPLLNQSETHAGENNHLLSYEHFKGNLYGFFESDFVSTAVSQTSVSSFAASSDTWAATGVPVLNSSATEESSGADPSRTLTVQSTHANRLLVVVAAKGALGALPSAVNWNGDALTKLVQTGTGSGDFSVWYIVNPDTGSHSVTTTWSDTEHQMAVLDFYGVDQSTPFGAVIEPATVDANSIAINSVVTVKNDIAFYAIAVAGAASFTPSGATEITDSQSSNIALHTMWERATGTSTSASSSFSTTDIANAIGVAIKAAGASIAIDDTVAAGLRLFGTTVHKGSLFALGTKAGAEGQYEWNSSADAATWAGGAGSAWPTTVYVHTTETRKNDWSNKFADIMSDGDNLIVALYEDPDSSGGTISQIRIGYSANAGTAWTFNAGLIIPCTDTPNIKLLHFNDLYTAGMPEIPILVTSDNIYKLDIGNHVFQEFLPQGILSGTAGEALAADVGADGNLYISKTGGDILQISFHQQGNKVIQNVGPQSYSHFESNDGLEGTRQGYATYIDGSDPVWLFVGYGGKEASGKKASIFAMNYVTGAWHSFYLHGTANEQINTLVISTEDDGTARLHADATSLAATASTAFMFEEPLVSATTGVTQNYKTTGYVEWAEDDLGDPHTSAAVMRALIDDGGTLGSGTTTNYVQLQYGLDGADYDDETLSAKFLSSAKSLNFDPTNNRGISAKTLKVKLNLFGADAATTNTPQIKEYEIQARNRVSVLRGWEIAIDLDASAEFQSTEQPANPETVVSNLLTVQNSVTLVGLTVGEGAEAQVEMTTGEWMLELIDASGGDGLQSGRVSGRALVVLEEVL